MSKHKDKGDSNTILGVMTPPKWAMALTFFGLWVMAAGIFTPRWRADDYGTANIEDNWQFNGFSSKKYGLLQVIGTYSQSWSVIAISTCQYRDISAATALISTAVTVFQSEGDLTGCGTNDCSQGFFQHMQTRCVEYERLQILSNMTLGFSCVSVLMTSAALILGSMAKSKKVGGIVAGLCIFAGIFALISNMVWAFQSDSSFKKLAENAYYPYPSLGIAWFMHLYGALTIIGAMSWYAVLVMPSVMEFDPVEQKIKKKEKKLNMLKQAAAIEEQNQQMMGQQMYQQGMAPQQGYPQQGYPQQGGDFGLQQGPPAMAVNYGGGMQVPPPAAGYGQNAMMGDCAYGQMPPPQPYGQPQMPQRGMQAM